MENKLLHYAVLFLGFIVAGKAECITSHITINETELSLSGGELSISDSSPNAFSYPAPNATQSQKRIFVVGNSFFNTVWVQAPSSTSGRDGLGPLFNARACSSCHIKDGRGSPPSEPKDNIVGLLFRLAVADNKGSGKTQDEPNYGGQFQNNAVMGVDAEGEVAISYKITEGHYPDGSSFHLREPIYDFHKLNYGKFHPDTHISPRVAPQLVGLGLIEAISEQDIVSQEDPLDSNQDGISGRAHWRLNETTGDKHLGRFGWKSEQQSLERQNAAAFVNDIGITSRLFPLEVCSSVQKNCRSALSGGQPELNVEPVDKLQRITMYTQLLAVPARRQVNDPQVKKGEIAFREIGCESCHHRAYVTGSLHELSQLHKQKIQPYSDFLLHDMGSGLSDITSSKTISSLAREWRTAPLWGIGLIPIVNGHSFLLHDGRARNVEEAILWHSGEAEKSKEKFMNLSKSDRDALIKFVNSL